jgi:hypothetical protein
VKGGSLILLKEGTVGTFTAQRVEVCRTAE